MSPGIHLIVATDPQTLSVHLGPAWWLERQDVQLAVGDEVGVEGSRIQFEGRPALVSADCRATIGSFPRAPMGTCSSTIPPARARTGAGSRPTPRSGARETYFPGTTPGSSAGRSAARS